MAPRWGFANTVSRRRRRLTRCAGTQRARWGFANYRRLRAQGLVRRASERRRFVLKEGFLPLVESVGWTWCLSQMVGDGLSLDVVQTVQPQAELLCADWV